MPLLFAIGIFLAVSSCGTSSISLEQKSPMVSSLDATIDKLPHPRKANEQALQDLLLTNEQPKPEHIADCKHNLELAAKDAVSDNEIIEAKKLVTTLVSRDFNLYHWCFYQLMRDCDKERLVEGVDNKNKLTNFNNRMKYLWVLARALDNVYQEPKYFNYLRKRYMDISTNYFGRKINVMGRPFDEKPKKVEEETGEP